MTRKHPQNGAGARKRGGSTKDRRRPKTRAERTVVQADGYDEAGVHVNTLIEEVPPP